MLKTKLIALSVIPLFFWSQMANADYQKEFEAIKSTVDACIPVKPLPPKLTLHDVEMLEKASYGPAWCRLLCQMGYIWPKPRTKALPPSTRRAVEKGRLAAKNAADQCLIRSAVKMNSVMKYRLIAYVGHQHACDKLRDQEICRRARDIAIDFLYGGNNPHDVQIRKTLKKLISKSKECNARNELRQYCKQLGVKDDVCNEL
jgi:hypothetical protein